MITSSGFWCVLISNVSEEVFYIKNFSPDSLVIPALEWACFKEERTTLWMSFCGKLIPIPSEFEWLDNFGLSTTRKLFNKRKVELDKLWENYCCVFLIPRFFIALSWQDLCEISQQCNFNRNFSIPGYCCARQYARLEIALLSNIAKKYCLCKPALIKCLHRQFFLAILLSNAISVSNIALKNCWSICT